MTAPGKDHPETVWRVAGRNLLLGTRPLVMGIVNVTPDSFSDGGQFLAAESAIAHGLALAAEGADLLDIGGESTRPGAEPVGAEEELVRVVPVVEALARQTTVPLSVDTSKAVVARECLRRGAQIVNDVTALAGDPDMAALVNESGAGAILMHMPGNPVTMQQAAHYDDVMGTLVRFFEARLRELTAAGLERERLVLDPGIGFGKGTTHNLEILARLSELQRFGLPICLGVSRKGFLGKIVGGRDVRERLAGSLAVACFAAVRGTAQIMRVHDVRETRDALEVIAAIEASRAASAPGSPGLL
jgi:dihydropteroate synthase